MIAKEVRLINKYIAHGLIPKRHEEYVPVLFLLLLLGSIRRVLLKLLPLYAYFILKVFLDLFKDLIHRLAKLLFDQGRNLVCLLNRKSIPLCSLLDYGLNAVLDFLA